jgi:hypothetical protein
LQAVIRAELLNCVKEEKERTITKKASPAASTVYCWRNMP